jgi:SAM-dependent methyltransferase
MRYCPTLLILLFLTLTASCDTGPARTSPAEDGDSAPVPTDTTLPKDEDFFEDYTDADRFAWQKPNIVLGVLGDVSESTIADIGSGTGFFVPYLVERANKVIAIDIDDYYLDSLRRLRATLDPALRPKMEVRTAQVDDPNLAPGEADVILMVNTFMWIEDKVPYLRKLRTILRPGGRLIIVDFKKKRTNVGPDKNLRLPLFELEDMLEAAGFQSIKSYDGILDYQYIVVSQPG